MNKIKPVYYILAASILATLIASLFDSNVISIVGLFLSILFLIIGFYKYIRL